MKTWLFVLVLSAAAWAQNGDTVVVVPPRGGVVPSPDIVGAAGDIANAGSRAYGERREANAKAKLMREQAELLKQQAEALRQQNELLKRQVAATQQQAADYAKSGTEFLAVCDQPGPATVEKFECLSYIEGVVAGTELAYQMNYLGTHPDDKVSPSLYCYPENSTLGDDLNVVTQFIKTHPSHAHMQTRLLVFMAASDAFGCAKQAQR